MYNNIKKKELFRVENSKANHAYQNDRDVTRQAYKPKSRMFGAVDLGTNNCRLLIARPKNKGFHVTTSYSRIVRLGEGLFNNGFLSELAMDRTIAALNTCSKRLNSFDNIKSRSIATEACRRAENCDEFITRVEKETGLKLEIITSNEEARLALRGCQRLLNPTQTYAIVFDIGGGSTEIIWAKKGLEHYDILDVLSLPFGVISLIENIGNSVTNRDHYMKMVSYVSLNLPNFCNRNDIRRKIKEQNVQMLGTSGTITTLGAVHLNLSRYDRSMIDGLNLKFSDLNEIIIKLTEMGFENRKKIPSIGNERAELIFPGCAILEAICKRWPIGELRVADRGLREGMLLELMIESGIPVTGNPAANTLRKDKIRI